MEYTEKIDRVERDLKNHYPKSPSLYVSHTEQLLGIVKEQNKNIEELEYYINQSEQTQKLLEFNIGRKNELIDVLMNDIEGMRVEIGRLKDT